MIRFHFYDMDFGLDEDPVADLAAHRELLAEDEKLLRWAEHVGDHRKAVRLYQEIAYRQAEIARLERKVRRRTA